MDINMKRSRYIIFMIINIGLLVFIVYLSVRIYKVGQDNAQGTHETKIKASSIVRDATVGSKLQYFYEPKPNNIEIVHEDWLNGEVHYTINSDSLNERKEYPLLKSETYRIITLGDSFTFGVYVNTDENYSELLEDQLSLLDCPNNLRFEVINLGVHGYDLEYSVERFIRRGIKYIPDLVIWLVNRWNISDVNELSKPLADKLKEKGVPYFNETSREFEAAVLAQKQILIKFGENYINDYQRRVLNRYSEIYDGQTLVFSFSGNLSDTQKNLIDNFIDLNASYHFVDDLFDYWASKEYQLYDRHPNRPGHKKIADLLYQYLLQHYFITCKVSSY